MLPSSRTYIMRRTLWIPSLTFTPLLALLLVLPGRLSRAETIIDFETLPVNASGFYDGDITAGIPFRDNYTILKTESVFGGTDNENIQEWEIGGVTFSNQYNTDFLSWSGWVWSNVTDSTTAGFGNQYASYPGGGAKAGGVVDDGGTYALAYNSGYFNIPDQTAVSSLFFTNTTYTGLAVEKGDDGNAIPYVSGPFGSQTGDLDPNGDDFLRINFTGYDDVGGNGNVVGTETRYLADYRSDKSDNVDAALFGGADYTLDSWLEADLTSLSGSKSIAFTLETTDTSFGFPNTPTYVAIDNLTLTAIPEPSTTALLGALAVTTIGCSRRRRRPR